MRGKVDSVGNCTLVLLVKLLIHEYVQLLLLLLPRNELVQVFVRLFIRRQIIANNHCWCMQPLWACLTLEKGMRWDALHIPTIPQIYFLIFRTTNNFWRWWSAENIVDALMASWKTKLRVTIVDCWVVIDRQLLKSWCGQTMHVADSILLSHLTKDKAISGDCHALERRLLLSILWHAADIQQDDMAWSPRPKQWYAVRFLCCGSIVELSVGNGRR